MTPGREDGEIVELTAIERKICCALRPDDDAERGVLGLQQGLGGLLPPPSAVRRLPVMATLTFACWLICSTMPFCTRRQIRWPRP